MIIEIGSRWIKDGEVVEVKQVSEILNDNLYYSVIWFSSLTENYKKTLTKRDFLEQYNTFEEPKKTVVIEKWLCYDNLSESYSICAESNIDGFINDDRDYLSKVKLIDTWEIPL